MDDLFVDPKEMLRESIASAVRPFARLAREGWGFYPEPSFYGRDATVRILVVLLGRKASFIHQKAENDRLSREELCTLADVSDNTYRPYAPRLEREGLIQRDGDDVWIPELSIIKACNIVLGKIQAERSSAPRSSQKDSTTREDLAHAESSVSSEEEREASPDLGDGPRLRKRRSFERTTNGPRRAGSLKDYQILFSGRADISGFPHPDELGEPARLAMLPLLIAREAYNFEGLPLGVVSDFLAHKYGRTIPEEDLKAVLDPLRGRYLDVRRDTHLKKDLYCLTDLGRSHILQIREEASHDSPAGASILNGG